MIARRRYYSQRARAKTRNIEFDITFEDWYEWWLSKGVDKDIPPGPLTRDTLCMCRYNDCGPYALSNIYCDTMSNNSSRPGSLNPMYGLKGSNQHTFSKIR